MQRYTMSMAVKALHNYAMRDHFCRRAFLARYLQPDQDIIERSYIEIST